MLQTIDEIHIDSLDRSTDRISIGEKVWEWFALLVEDNPNLTELNQACNAINANTRRIRRNPKDGAVRWLSAMHVVYNGGKDDVKRCLQGIPLLFSPDAGFLDYAQF